MSDDRLVPPSSEAFERFRNYHRLVLGFSMEALGPLPLGSLLQRACECASEGTSVRRAKVLRFQPAEDDFLVIAGIGWKPGIVGHGRLPSDMRSPPGRAFRTGVPTFIDNLPADPEFDTSDLLREHGIVSLVNVPITVDGLVWGILEVDSDRLRRFDLDDHDFLCGFAAIIGRSIENRQQLELARQAGLDQTIELREREALFSELQHRVGNQLQLIIGALELASRRAAQPDARAAIEDVTRRVVSIAHSHEQLSLARVERDISLEIFISGLIPTLAVPERITIRTAIADATAPIATAVRVGLILNELVTNSVKHAFGEGDGTITISLSLDEPGYQAMLRVEDNGCGMKAPQVGGAGTGLIRTLAAQIGGRAEWLPPTGRGTAFVLSFPLHGGELSLPPR